MDWITAIIDAAARETMLFAAAGLLIGGLDDLIVDLCFLVRRGMGRGAIPAHLDRLPAPTDSGCFAIFVAAWDEQAVIGQMLTTAVARIDHPDYRLYVGVYPNDPGTIAAARAVAATDPRIRVIGGPCDGPTTKADCLNSLWRALVADATERPIKAVVLHDAEDVVHAAELTVFDTLIEGCAVVQLPAQDAMHAMLRHMHDELGASLTRISLLSETVRDELASPPPPPRAPVPAARAGLFGFPR